MPGHYPSRLLTYLLLIGIVHAGISASMAFHLNLIMHVGLALFGM